MSEVMHGASRVEPPEPPAGHNGLHLRDAGIAYRDGAEAQLLDIVRTSTDRSSTSDELQWAATDWPTLYSLSRSRPNILRGFDIPAAAKVLEIGCGCGPLTRYLGENCAKVDAVEPVEVRAAVARERTADLPSVQVFVGTIEDIPAEPVYDVVVVVGVLGYVGAGTADAAPYREFLRQCQERLVDGGSLILAIENALGVKYLAGSPEDHTDRVFDSLESYPVGGHARVFSRDELRSLVESAGLSVDRTLGVFPDYKIPRVVMADEIFDCAPHLAWRMPVFPSPDWISPRPRLAAEWRLWRTLSRAGIGPHTTNSFVLLATKGTRAPQLWRTDRLAIAWSTERRTGYATETTVRLDDSGVVLERHPIPRACPGSAVSDTPRSWTEPLIHGSDVIELCSDDPSAVDGVLSSWRDMLAGRSSVPLDLVPHNLLVQSDGSLVPIDQEWPEADVERVRTRGAFLLANKLAGRSLPDAWPDATVGALAERFRRAAGGKADPAAWTCFVDAEVELLARVIGPETGQKRSQLRAGFAEILGRPMPTSELSNRHLDAREQQVPDLLTSLADERHALATANDQLATVRRDLAAAVLALTALREQQLPELLTSLADERHALATANDQLATVRRDLAAAVLALTELGEVSKENDQLAEHLRDSQSQVQAEVRRANDAEAEVARHRADEKSTARRALTAYRRTVDRAAPWGTRRRGFYLRLRAWGQGHRYVRPAAGPTTLDQPEVTR